jgi:hypothetical protein
MRGQGLQGVVPAVGPRANRDRSGGVRLGGGAILRERGQATLQPGDVPRQDPQLAPSQVLLVRMVLLEDMQPVQHGVRLGQRQDSGMARGDGFHLGVGELLGADVLRLPHRTVAGEDLRDKPGLGLQGLPEVGVEGALRDVAVDRDFLVSIVLTQDPAITLLYLGWLPGGIEVV